LKKRRMCLNSVPFLLLKFVKVFISLFSQRMWSNGSIFGKNEGLPKVRTEAHWNVTETGCEMFSDVFTNTMD
jgi:hypothetical protein